MNPEAAGIPGSAETIVKFVSYMKWQYLPADIGRVLSLALKLRNRNRGTSQTHRAKKDAISGKPGAPGEGLRYDLVCLASWVTLAK